jgi:hypothetical protein
MQRIRSVFGHETADRMFELGLAPLPESTLCCLLARAGHALADVRLCIRSGNELAAQVGGDVAAKLSPLRMVLFDICSLSHLLPAAGFPAEDLDRIIEMGTFRLAVVASGRPWPGGKPQ